MTERMNKPEFEQFDFADAEIIFRHFNGVKDDFHAAGKRDFCIKINEEEAKQLIDKGIVVKPMTSSDPDAEMMYYVKIRVGYGVNDNGKRWGPRVYVYTDKTRRILNENTISILDDARIVHADISSHVYRRRVNGKDTATLWADVLHVTVKENMSRDPFAEKYAAWDTEPVDPNDCPF